MLSLIEVKCPHCGARGQLMLPPLGVLIVGPCPECGELVVVFCGRVLPLDKEIILNAPFEEKREHLMTVLTSFLEEYVVRLLKDNSSVQEEGEQETIPEGEAAGLGHGGNEVSDPARQSSKRAISAGEIADFIRLDLNLIDNTDYFKAIFG